MTEEYLTSEQQLMFSVSVMRINSTSAQTKQDSEDQPNTPVTPPPRPFLCAVIKFVTLLLFFFHLNDRK